MSFFSHGIPEKKKMPKTDHEKTNKTALLLHVIGMQKHETSIKFSLFLLSLNISEDIKL